MKRRRKISRRKSRKLFKRTSGVHKKNVPVVRRGGLAL